MKARFEELFARLRRSGADYADIRWVETRRESVKIRNGEVIGIGGGFDRGFGIRVIVDGCWGFAATDEGESGLERTASAAVESAKAAALTRRAAVRLAEAEPVTGNWSSHFSIDPFDVPLETKIALLLDSTERMRTDDRIVSAEGELSIYRQEKIFASSEGSYVEQSTTECGGGISAVAVSGEETHRRSYPSGYGGNQANRGWEFILEQDFSGSAVRIRDEALALLTAPKAPAGFHDLIVGASQLALQIHESCGHPTELDRIFGTELSLAGGSFLDPGMLGKFRYGSDRVTIAADATVPGGIGTFGYDDEGTPARRTVLVDRGILTGFLTSRETAEKIGQRSGGTMRAESWNHLPLIRMVNVNLDPGEDSFENLVLDTRKGILVETNKAWSIDDVRLNFQFGCEIAWEIENGRIGRILKSPVYTGITPQFWGRCDAISNRDAWTLWGVPNCGKGDPMQVVRVAHGASPARFHGVEMQ